MAGELSRADELLSAGEHNPETALDARLTRLEWVNNARPDGVGHQIQSVLPGMLEQLAELGDERRLAKAHMAAFWAHWAVSRARPAAAELRLAADHAARAGDNGLRARALGWQVAALMWGPFDAGAVARELETLEREQEMGPFLAASVTLLRGELARLHGDLDEALAITSQAKDQFAAIGGYVMVGGSDQLLARVEVLAGRLDRARDLLLRSDALFERVGDRGFRLTTLAMLARVEEMVGHPAAARSAIELCEQIGGKEDVINFAITYAVRARLALADGENEAAERWARKAVDSALVTDFTFVQGEAVLTLCFVLESSAVARNRRLRQAGRLSCLKPRATVLTPLRLVRCSRSSASPIECLRKVRHETPGGFRFSRTCAASLPELATARRWHPTPETLATRSHADAKAGLDVPRGVAPECRQ